MAAAAVVVAVAVAMQGLLRHQKQSGRRKKLPVVVAAKVTLHCDVLRCHLGGRWCSQVVK